MIVSYADDETPEMAAGWCYWIDGAFGNAASYEAARAKIEELIEKRKERA